MSTKGVLKLNSLKGNKQNIKPKPETATLKNKSDPVETNTNNSDKISEESKKARAKERLKKQIEQYKSTLILIQKSYPKCFLYPPKALAVGIFQSLLEREIAKPEELRLGKTQIRRFLGKYTSTIKYKECLLEGSYRVDLDGKDAEKVTKEHAEFACEEITQRKGIRKRNFVDKPKTTKL